MKKKLYLLITAWLLPNTALAAGPFHRSDFLNGFGISTSTADPQAFALDALNVLLWVTGAAGFFAIVYYGILMVTSKGEEGQVEKAKVGLTWAVIGLVVVVLALYLITATKKAATPSATKETSAVGL